MGIDCDVKGISVFVQIIRIGDSKYLRFDNTFFYIYSVSL